MRAVWRRKFLIVLLVGCVWIAGRSGYLPLGQVAPMQVASTMGPLGGLMLDWRLAELAYNPDLCLKTLTGPGTEATRVPDRPLKDGCGWTNAVSLVKAGGASVGVTISCPAAAALSLWMVNVVQPAAEKHLAARVTGISHGGGYSCRRIRGRMDFLMSEHATANALDIMGLRTSSGQSISVLNDWDDKGAVGAFLREIHDGACDYFRVAIGPEHNKLHKDHFHYDRGILWWCA